jgi:hypothetical protein
LVCSSNSISDITPDSERPEIAVTDLRSYCIETGRRAATTKMVAGSRIGPELASAANAASMTVSVPPQAVAFDASLRPCDRDPSLPTASIFTRLNVRFASVLDENSPCANWASRSNTLVVLRC